MTETIGRSYAQERAYGVENMRGLLIGTAISLGFWAVIGLAVYLLTL